MPLNPEAEKMIEVFTDFVNCHLAAQRDDYTISRKDYDYQDEGYDGTPKILLDQVLLKDTIYEHRIITIYADPYQDEGGPNHLTGFFRPYDGGWDLDELLQLFDTEYHTLLENGHRTDAWPEEVRNEDQ